MAPCDIFHLLVILFFPLRTLIIYLARSLSRLSSVVTCLLEYKYIRERRGELPLAMNAKSEYEQSLVVADIGHRPGRQCNPLQSTMISASPSYTETKHFLLTSRPSLDRMPTLAYSANSSKDGSQPRLHRLLFPSPWHPTSRKICPRR